jgi:hypothetical protein
MSEDRKKKGGLTIPLTEDGRKDSCKMTERRPDLQGRVLLGLHKPEAS